MHRRTIRPFAFLLTAALAGSASAAGPVNLFVIERGADGPVMRATPIAAGETRTLEIGDGSAVIDVIFPPGRGQSASLVDPDEPRQLLVRHAGGQVRVEVRSPDGTTRELPPRAVDDLARYHVRVSVTGGGRASAFLIRQNETVRDDAGPVANMFAGRVPQALLDNGYVVQTETYRHDAGPAVTGIVPLRVDRWPFARVTLPDGTEADFIVDLGAGETVVGQDVLPAETQIEPLAMVEHPAAGTRILEYAPGGATGQVQSVAGEAMLPRLMLGEVEVANVRATVLERMPDLFGRPVGGILGIDVLRRCERLTLRLGDEAPSLRFGAASPPAAGVEAIGAIEVPFSLVGTHPVVPAMVNGASVFFILDTGAPTPFLDESAARATGVATDASSRTATHGLDGGTIEHAAGLMGTLTLGGRTFEEVPCRIAELAPFRSIRREDQHVGLLGNDFFGRFDRIELDFARHVVRFVE